MSVDLCTIIIPVSPDHKAVVTEAIQSAYAQTIACRVLTIDDPQRTGAGAVRNRGVMSADTPFVVFLDADDLLAPTFVEECARAWQAANYVYTDFIVHKPSGEIAHWQTPPCEMHSIWQKGQMHLNTVFVPRELHFSVGGYDETLPAMEDTDYFLKLHSRGACGVHVGKPLVTYRANLGKRSDYLRASTANQDQLEALLKGRYARFANTMCSCNGSTTPLSTTPKNEAFDGAILAQATYPPMKKVGRATGRTYDRAGNGDVIYVHAEDARLSPDWWKPIAEERQTFTPAIDEIRDRALAELKKAMV